MSRLDEVEFDAEGKRYVLQYSHEALILLEDKLDKGLMKIMREVESWAQRPEDIRLGTIRNILWAGLHKHHPELTTSEAAELIGKIDGGIVGAIELIGEGFQRAFNAPGTKGTNPPQRAQNGTGTPSGSSTSATGTTPPGSGTSPRESGS